MTARHLALFSLTIALILAVPVACGGSDKKPEKPKKKAQTAEQLIKDGARAEKKEDIKRAESRYRKAVRLEPDNADANNRLIELLSRQDRLADAIEAANAYLAADDKNAIAYHIKADLERKAGRFDAADETLSVLLERDPTDDVAFHKRGEVRVLGDNIAGAIGDFQSAVELDGENVEYLVSLGSALQQTAKNQEAMEILSKVLAKDDDHPRANRIIGTIHRDELRLDEAVSHHLKAVRLDPESGRAHFELGITQNMRADNLAAEESLRKATELEPDIAINWYAYGESLRVQDKNEAAVAAYEKTLELEPEHPKAANKLGYVLFKVGNIAQAEVVLTAAIKRNPDDPHPYYNLGVVYAEGKKYSLAVNALKRFVELAPEGDHDLKSAKRQIRSLTRKIRR